MYTLYYSEGSCSMAVHALLNEIGAAFELKDTSIKAGRNRSPEFLRINPRGAVPVLVDDGHVIREGGAILIYLADKHQSPLLPRSGKERATALEWLLFANSTLHPAYSRTMSLKRSVEDAAVRTQLQEAGIQHITRLWQEVEDRLSQNAYVAGEDCTLADILLAVIANWQGYLPEPITFGPNIKRLLAAVTARPAFQKALREENVEYKAAA